MSTVLFPCRPFAGVFLSRPGLGPVVVLLTCLGLCWTPASEAETTNYSGAIAITALPCQITTPGTYYLAADLTVSNQNAIVISAANVTLDLNGHALADTSGPSALSTGVYVTGNHVTILHGRVSGFTFGVTTVGNGCRVEDVAVTGATYCGICSPGADTLIRCCRVTNTGGSTSWSDPSAYGILVYNTGIRVVDCDVRGVTPNSGGTAGGIVYSVDGAGQLSNNRVGGASTGIAIAGATTKYRDNLCTPDVATPYSGGTDAGNNE